MCFKSKIMITVLGTLMLLALMVEVNGEPQVPCLFVFGDSLVDNGNNNGLTTAAKVNFPPYGVDFPDGPTGRFCNGPNFSDIIAQLLEFDRFITPFTNTTGTDILFGVNYGSGGGGIRNETGKELGERFSMNEQLKNHGITVSRIVSIKKSSALNYLSKCIYTVGMGSNDYINNYLQPDFYSSSTVYTPDQFAALLIKQYALQLTKLYFYGARKVVVFGLGLIGCTPAEIAINGADASGCVDRINNYTQLFNNRLQPLVDYLNQDLPNAKFTYINIAQISSSSSSSGGGLNSSVPCCSVNNFGLCVPNSIPCPVRDAFTFFDAFHPTTMANSFIGAICYNASSIPTAAQPYDISTLAGL